MCIVVMYGIPLRVGPPAPTERERRQIRGLMKRRGGLEAQIKASEKDPTALKVLRDQMAAVQNQIAVMSRAFGNKAVDSDWPL